MRYEDIVGYDIEVVRDGSKLPEVIKGGKRQLGVLRKVGQMEYIVNMVSKRWTCRCICVGSS